MKDFTDWFVHLIEDERFYENASRNHRKETVESTARKIYEVATVDRGMFEITSIAEHRKHLLFKLYKIPADKIKKNWHEIALEEKQQEEAKNKKPEEPPLVRGSEQYLKRTQEVLDAIKAIAEPKRIAPMPQKEIDETGQIDLPKPPPYPSTSESEVIKHALHLAYIKENYDPRTGFKLENWIEEYEWLKQLEE